MTDTACFDPDCARCPRLAGHLSEIRRAFPAYHGRPVAPFGDPDAHLLIVGLAPGLHGANATGRPFTGDYAGILLYRTLYRFGFSNQPEGAAPDDGLRLIDCRITNAVKCLPPANKPNGSEVATCNAFLRRELQTLPQGAVVLALGRIAHGALVRARELTAADFPFAHGRAHAWAGGWLVDSYHCSRYNTQTQRLTVTMFEQVFAQVRALLGQCASAHARPVRHHGT